MQQQRVSSTCASSRAALQPVHHHRDRFGRRLIEGCDEKPFAVGACSIRIAAASRTRSNSGWLSDTHAIWCQREEPAVNFPDERKKISFPSLRHRGNAPPLVDTSHFSPVGGKGATKTSNCCCDSFVSYAIHLPSGENWPNDSVAVVAANGTGFRSPDSGSTIRSFDVPAFICMNSDVPTVRRHASRWYRDHTELLCASICGQTSQILHPRKTPPQKTYPDIRAGRPDRRLIGNWTGCEPRSAVATAQIVDPDVRTSLSWVQRRDGSESAVRRRDRDRCSRRRHRPVPVPAA